MTIPLDVWAMMIFSVLVFFGVSIATLIYTLRQEEQKMDVLRTEGRLDTHSPAALRDLKRWLDAHPDDPDAEAARETYETCVEAVRTTNRHFHRWTEADIESVSTR